VGEDLGFMDRQLLERMIGAGVLIVALVLIAPAILDGRRGGEIAVYSNGHRVDKKVATGIPESSQRAPAMRTHTIVLDHEPDRPPVARPVTEPAVAAEPEKESANPNTPQVPGRPSMAPVVADQVIADPSKADPVSVELPASGWSVQLGSFAERPNAERLAGDVKSRGFSAYLEPLTQSGRTYYRVRVGPRQTRDQASELAGGLAKSGFTGQVIQQQPAP
jgi:DedD protein